MPEEKKARATGTYVYDKKLGKVVKVSDEIPGLNKSGGEGHVCGASCHHGDSPCGMGGSDCGGCGDMGALGGMGGCGSGGCCMGGE